MQRSQEFQNSMQSQILALQSQSTAMLSFLQGVGHAAFDAFGNSRGGLSTGSVTTTAAVSQQRQNTLVVATTTTTTADTTVAVAQLARAATESRVSNTAEADLFWCRQYCLPALQPLSVQVVLDMWRGEGLSDNIPMSGGISAVRETIWNKVADRLEQRRREVFITGQAVN